MSSIRIFCLRLIKFINNSKPITVSTAATVNIINEYTWLIISSTMYEKVKYIIIIATTLSSILNNISKKLFHVEYTLIIDNNNNKCPNNKFKNNILYII